MPVGEVVWRAVVARRLPGRGRTAGKLGRHQLGRIIHDLIGRFRRIGALEREVEPGPVVGAEESQQSCIRPARFGGNDLDAVPGLLLYLRLPRVA